MKKNVRINELLEYLKEGRMEEAQMDFFADDVVVTADNGELVKGKENTIKSLHAFAKEISLTRFIHHNVSSVAENGTDSFYSVSMKVEVNGGENFETEQVVHNKWKDGKVVYERYYHE